MSPNVLEMAASRKINFVLFSLRIVHIIFLLRSNQFSDTLTVHEHICPKVISGLINILLTLTGTLATWSPSHSRPQAFFILIIENKSTFHSKTKQNKKISGSQIWARKWKHVTIEWLPPPFFFRTQKPICSNLNKFFLLKKDIPNSKAKDINTDLWTISVLGLVLNLAWVTFNLKDFSRYWISSDLLQGEWKPLNFFVVSWNREIFPWKFLNVLAS